MAAVTFLDLSYILCNCDHQSCMNAQHWGCPMSYNRIGLISSDENQAAHFQAAAAS